MKLSVKDGEICNQKTTRKGERDLVRLRLLMRQIEDFVKKKERELSSTTPEF